VDTVRAPLVLAVAALVGMSACAGTAADAEPTVDTSATTTTTTSSTTTSSTTTTTTTSTTTTTTSTTTTSTIVPEPEAVADPWMTNANRAFDDLARANPAASMSIVRDGRSIGERAWGITIDGAPATSDSPMVVASVSKLLTALMIARLHQDGGVNVDAPFPWADVPIAAHPGWSGVTVRELLEHSSGMPVVRPAWFDGGTDCARFLPSVLSAPPTATRGRWTYSNGNYCALGLLVESTSWLPLAQAAQTILFDPLGLTGVHLSTDGHQPTDVEYRLGLDRLSRLGGAGTFIVSTADMAAVLASVSASDLAVLRWPAVIVDQYGWGHTGSVDGAVACAWVLEGGRTVVTVTVAGSSPSTGGAVCDRVVPAVSRDLGIGDLGPPDRSPP
jgi:CubicO group peptidase (beta-lactamase class C family)